MTDTLLLAATLVVVTVVCGTIAWAVWDLGRGLWLPPADQQRNRDQQHRHRQQGIPLIHERRDGQQQRYDYQNQKRR